MRLINWYGNNGHCFPEPDTVETAECGICGTSMSVRRNVLGPTSSAEAMAGKKHRHDHFICPHVNEGWHQKIYRLKIEVHRAEMSHASNVDEIKKTAEKKIRELLALFSA